ncbi:EboA domain-containing protein [Nitrospirillum sp. BR 11163]|uniref:EboA domain-containing protein n=1 Tax=Nitrospirillum sp. BR 11163 TaxID=3104323 RepID=UPI002AFF3114|nr:EboA domain-containing protein [Nitrospirillum sp. BR 11163]MEA1675977.1 EboA domain-containing protein [Nitrospirillum sp. BR 11163]
MNGAPQDLMWEWIVRRAPAPGRQWLEARLDQIATMTPGDPAAERAFDIAFGQVARQLGRGPLALTPADLATADAARPGWRPQGWSLEGAARILLLLRCPPSAPGIFSARFRRLRRVADPAEQVALFQGLPLYADPDVLADEVGEGLRTNMRPVFEAIAHDSPYPRERMDEHRWNHMVLKALFVDSTLAPIQGLDARANPGLARILRDYARERRAAGRRISPELWRCLGPYAAEIGGMDDLALAARSDDPEERAAAGAWMERNRF